MYKLLRKSLLLLLVGISLASAFWYWQDNHNRDRGSSALDNWADRIAPAKAALPIRQGVIGYVTEWDVPGAYYEFWDLETEYLLTQYELAPLILQKGAVAEWNVAVFSPRTFKTWKSIYGGEFEITFLGRGVYVLHRQIPE